MEEEEEKIVKGDDVIVDLDATLEDLYMGGSLKVRSYLAAVLCSSIQSIYLTLGDVFVSYCCEFFVIF